MSKFDFGKNFKKGAFCIFCTAGSAVAPFALSAGQVSAIGVLEKAFIKKLKVDVKEFFSILDGHLHFCQVRNDLLIHPRFSEDAKGDQVDKTLRLYGDREKFKKAEEEYINAFLEHEKSFCNLRDFFDVKEENGKIKDLFPKSGKIFNHIYSQRNILSGKFFSIQKVSDLVFAAIESKINKADLRKEMNKSLEEVKKMFGEVNVADVFGDPVSNDDIKVNRQRYPKILSNLIDCFEKIEEIIENDEKEDSGTSSFGKSCRLVYDKSF